MYLCKISHHENILNRFFVVTLTHKKITTMKGIITILATLIITMSSFMSVADENGPIMTFETKTHDFGTIKEANGPVTCDFEFTNTGNEPLVIISATASCGCTRPNYPKEPIKPGKNGKITVTYNPKGRPGEFDKSIKIRTNGNKRPILKITGVVIPQED